MKSAPAPASTPAPAPGSLGLVLSGGGARGVVHIGVLRALLEAGIEPDCVAGTSAGAIVGALYAAGHSPARMLEFFSGIHPIHPSYFTFKQPGLLDPRKLEPYFRLYWPEDSFAALHRRLFVVATDLFHARPVVFDSGPLVRPLLASAAVPFVYAPAEIDGTWYCDGGVADNFPARLLTGLCAPILGVHASPPDSVAPATLGSALAVAERALEIGMFLHAQSQFNLCDLVIRPPGTNGYTLFDMKHVHAIEALGYEAARARLPEIHALRRRPQPLPARPAAE